MMIFFVVVVAVVVLVVSSVLFCQLVVVVGAAVHLLLFRYQQQSILSIYRFSLCLISFSRCFQSFPTTSALLMCNGLHRYCDLRFNQFTFAATHNSYSRAESKPFKMYDKMNVPYADCFARNQDKSITVQLDNGIRSIEIDTCSKEVYDFAEDKYTTKIYACHKILFTSSVESILNEIDAWMKRNPNEVIVVTFTGKVNPKSRKTIATNIMNLLEKLWQPNEDRRLNKKLSLNDEFHKTGRWPMLWEAITLNQRIFLFVHPKLSSFMGKPSWAHDLTEVQHTQSNMKFQDSRNCRNLVGAIADQCTVYSKLISVDVYLPRGLPVCTHTRADACNRYIQASANLCYEHRRGHQLTINFLKIDFGGRHNGRGFSKLRRAVKIMNQRNVYHYLHWQSPKLL